MGMKERLDESYKKQNARRQGSLDYCSFFEGYSAGLTERDIVLEKLTAAKDLLKRWVDDRVYTVSEQKDLIADTEQFLEEE